MKTLTIQATSEESARGFLDGLAGFPAALLEGEDGSYLVELDLRGSDCQIVDVLNALASYVAARGQGPADVGLAGQMYSLHPA